VRAAVDKTLPPLAYVGPNWLGGLFGDPVVSPTSALAKDDAAAAKLWEFTERTTNLCLQDYVK
jgi:hypothetical protein